jgi:hypothetical protein
MGSPTRRRPEGAGRQGQPATLGRGAVSTGKLSSAAVLRLPTGPLAAHPDRSLEEWALLCRVDGRRPLSAVASPSGRGLAEAVAVAERLLAAGLIEHVADAEQGPDAEPDVDGAEPDTREGLADEADLTAEAGPDVPAGDAAGFPEAASPAAAGTSRTTAEEARIDSVSLLRELASESAAPRHDEPGADEAWEELATRLTGDQEQDATVASESGKAENAQPGDQPNRPPGRPSDQAAFMREFASLATDDDQPDAQPPTPESDGEQPEDRARGGRFGFRKGQRR